MKLKPNAFLEKRATPLQGWLPHRMNASTRRAADNVNQVYG